MAATKPTFAQVSQPRSWTLAHFLPGDFTEAKKQNFAPAAFPEAAFTVEDSSKPAKLTSDEVRALFPFDELLLSADAVFSAGGVLEAEAQVKAGGDWSPWFSFGRFDAAGGGSSVKDQQNDFGRMDVDILKLKRKAEALRYRVTLTPEDGKAALRLVGVSYTDASAAYSAADAAAKPASFRQVRVQVPSYSQMIQQVNYAGDICSPVSLSMTLSGFGRRVDPIPTAAAVRDDAENIYGNWFLNTAYAGSRGLYAFLARLNTLEDARAFLEAGYPVIASVTFGPDELKNSPLKKTRGHLLVITGFDAKGDVLVHDPAAPEEKTVARTYKRAEFASAWLKNKYGTSYIIARDLNRFVAVKDRVAELYSMPPKDDGERKKLIETQLVFNERAELMEISGPWARAKAVEQHSLKSNGRDLSPYEGWLPADALAFSLPLDPTAVVKSKTARSGSAEFSMGVKLRVAGGLALPAGKLQAKDLNPLPVKTPAAQLRPKILEAARAFLGDKYYWGGRSAWGIDCSGLVNLAYRTWGLDLPRNAGDQFAASKSVAADKLQPADLIFSADADRPAAITHVMLYAGGGKLIEATGDTNSVREVTFAEKFGADFKKARNGMVSQGKKIFFRRVLN
jgi:hypothetical protein